MRPDIISAAEPGNPHVQRWLDALERDIAAGLVPQWIGAIVVSVCADGRARMTLIEWDRWAWSKLEQQIGLN